ncbi:MAG: PQQ-dependent sugar dehydrogenase [Gloeomargarita sp. SKYBB_i_bin120]|nr:PQQ-dependent sugar dehydrogenase [Gloeomargarita sp. SKYB120]MDW8178663.1 PQQ-dependent sugar dehydrogenase [Gloeomargarita sp. SKYBB_i_bin120]
MRLRWLGWVLLLGLLGCRVHSQPEPLPVSQVQPATRYRVVSVIKGLERPWGMVWLPNGDMLITERPGRLRWVQGGKLRPEPVPGIPPVLNLGQGGLLDIALHPCFPNPAWVYFTYAQGTVEANRTVVGRGTWQNGRLTEVREIFRVAQTKYRTQHFGSRLAWLPDFTLLVSIGDGGNPPISYGGRLIREQAQNPKSHLGKVLRLNPDGTAPADNPLGAKAAPEVWTLGNRNIQGLVVDPVTGQVWATEHGAKGGDEVNRLEAGKNYGWPRVTHSREYSGEEITPYRSLPGMVDPALVWPGTVAPSGLTIYRGERFPDWQGQLLAGGLRSRAVHRLQVLPNGKVKEVERIDLRQRVRDVRVGPDGLVYVLTDADDGQLLRIEPVP